MKIRELRQKMNLSQNEMAKKLGIPHTTLFNYEASKSEPNIETLIKLADFFNITIDELVGRPIDIVNLNFLDDTRKNLIKEIVNANNSSVARLDAFWQGVKYAEEEREELIKHIKGKK